MNENSDSAVFERPPSDFSRYWETSDRSYDRVTTALRRWVDGMEAALENRKL